MFEYSSTGVMTYGPGIRAAVLIKEDISDYYRKLIPEYKYCKPPRYRAHITVVRFKKEWIEKEFLDKFWGKHSMERVEFDYSGEIKFSHPYYYLECDSEEICEIRRELGLSPYRFDDSKFHITIGNVK